MKFTDGLWLHVAREVAAENSDIEFDDRIVDNMCMQLVQRPEEYDMLVLPNLYGDVLSDLCAGMIGGLGLAPGGELRRGRRGVRADARLRAEVRRARTRSTRWPSCSRGCSCSATSRSATAADRLERAIAEVIAEGKSVTYDMKPSRDDPTAVGTSEVADAIIEKLEASVPA